MTAKIMTVSSANTDLSMRVESCPEKGQTVLGESYCYVQGGKGANSAITVAKLGGKSIFCASLGDDANGDALLKIYEKNGVDTGCLLRTKEAPTGLATVTVESDGANRIVVFSGANMLLSPDHAEKSIRKETPDAVFCHFEIPFETVKRVSEVCYELKIPMFIDAGPADKNMPLETLKPVTVFSPNETETEIFTGIKPKDTESYVSACKALEKKVKAKYYVLKLGAKGVGVWDGKKFEVIPTYDVKVIDTTAAGDSFTAAMTYKYITDGDIYKACRYGNAVASVTVSRRGAGDSVPTKEELEVFVKEKGIII